MPRKLEVWLFSNHIGFLITDAGQLSFYYTPAWLAHPNASPLSCSLPLQTERFNDQATRPFFAGLLPEGKLRLLIAQQLHVSRQNIFALLDGIGGECAGAVTLLEPNQTLTPSDAISDIQWLSNSEVLTLLDEIPRRPMLVGADGLRLSLAGTQEKLPVIIEGDRIGLPRNGTPSSHILKPPISPIEGSVINDWFCMTLANRMHLQPAHVQIRYVENQTFLLVQRYDRILDPQRGLQRLHQEDFCQALGILPELKYQNEGGPNFASCFELLRRTTKPSVPQLLRLLDYIIFNALIGNHDAHAKNFSLLYTPQGAVLAPLYDVLSTAVYPHLSAKMAMKIGSKYQFSEVQARHWEQFAQNTGLSASQTRKRVTELAYQFPLAARQLLTSGNHKLANNPLLNQIVQLIEANSALTLQRLKFN